MSVYACEYVSVEGRRERVFMPDPSKGLPAEDS